MPVSALAALDSPRHARFGPARSFLEWWTSTKPVPIALEKGDGLSLTVWTVGLTRNFRIWPERELVIDLKQGILRRAPALQQAIAPLAPTPDAADFPLPVDDRVIAKRHARLVSAFEPWTYQDQATLVVQGKVTGAIPVAKPRSDQGILRLLLRVQNSFGRKEQPDIFLVLRWPVSPQTEIRLPKSGEDIVVALNPAIPAPPPDGGKVADGVPLPEWDLAIPLPVGVIAVVNGKTTAFHDPSATLESLPDVDRIRIRWTPAVPVYGQDATVLMKFLSWAVRQDPLRFPRPPIPIEIARELRAPVPGT